MASGKLSSEIRQSDISVKEKFIGYIFQTDEDGEKLLINAAASNSKKQIKIWINGELAKAAA